MDSIQLYVEALRDGAVWLSVGMGVLLLALFGLSAWLTLRTSPVAPGLVTAGSERRVHQVVGGTAEYAPPVAATLVDDPAFQGEIRVLQGQLARGEIDRATYAAELARLCRGEAA